MNLFLYFCTLQITIRSDTLTNVWSVNVRLIDITQRKIRLIDSINIMYLLDCTILLYHISTCGLTIRTTSALPD
jgi:hypothetical protein